MSEAQMGSLIELARAHLRSGRLTEAELTCQLALRADPDSSEALHLLGRVLLSAARAALAIPFLEKAAKRSPETASIQRTLGAALGGSWNSPGRHGCRGDTGRLDRID